MPPDGLQPSTRVCYSGRCPYDSVDEKSRQCALPPHSAHSGRMTAKPDITRKRVTEGRATTHDLKPLDRVPRLTCGIIVGQMESPAATILDVCMSYAVPRCLHVIADLGVADALDDSPRTPAELAASTGADAGALARALRLVSAYGIFEMRGEGYVHTPASRLLRNDHPQSMRSFVRMLGFPMYWKS